VAHWNDLEGTGKILQDTIAMDVQAVGFDWLRWSRDWKPLLVVNTNGKEVYNTERHYHPRGTDCRTSKMLYQGPGKTQYIRGTVLQPYGTKAEPFEIFLPEGVRPWIFPYCAGMRSTRLRIS
jgi:hypothetical protein